MLQYLTLYSLTAVLVLTSSVLALLLSWLWLRHSTLFLKRKSLPPGGMGWPIIGQSLEFLASRPSLASQPFIERHSARYGDIFKCHLFGNPFIISTNAKINDYILRNEDVLFQSCQPTRAHTWVLGEKTLTDIHTDMHMKIRDALTDLLSSDKSKGEIFDLLQNMMSTKLGSWQDQFVHVQHEATSFVLSLLLKCLLGHSVEDLELEDLQALYNESKNLLAFPLNIPGSGYRRHAECHRRLITVLRKRIDEWRTSKLETYPDFLEILWNEEQNGNLKDNSNLALDCLMGILFHGEETTAMAMTLIIKFLSESPRALDQIKEEHAAIYKRKGKAKSLTWEDYESMEFTKNVIKESLRLGNVVPWVCRVALQDVEIKGFIIPKGWKVLVFLMGPHIDGTCYHDPKSFNPWRWKAIGNDSNFIPYGAGLRCCPGEKAANMLLTIFLHLFITKYSWQVVGEDDMICFPVMTFQEGFPVVVKDVKDADECLILH
ncbi:hypothetical protein KP509_39G007100 [Ceratopteris richardii]|uniref:Cytochrome P450 n=1 Tax=Ceratopteris richardii TaxID=49495 RepID=A0A8T2PY33_CERRI|nr:hypothetical protein KP509_39G007100 [Ceratopteris richardii]KAH7276427.1 hypothetical protein KP509_39G007100 [Ceratopteris richardii]